MSNTIFFDAASTGHHGEFFENLICALPPHIQGSCLIVAHPDLRDRLVSLREVRKTKVKLAFFSDEEVSFLEEAEGIIQIGGRQLELLSNYVVSNRCERVVLMHMNLHQYALHAWRLPPDVEIAGILLNPYTPRSRAFGLRAQLFALLTGIRKRIQFTLLLRNQAISRIFLLNDEPMAKQLNRWYSRRPVFDSIPDPLPSRSPFIESKLKDDHVRPFTFLLAGSLAPRKGCLETLEAIAHASKRLARPLRLRIMGRFRDEASAYRDRVMCALHRLQVELAPSHMRVEIEDGFIDNKSLSRAFAESDCVLAPYLEFYGSSGMIGHACRYQKPLLACRDGLLG
ncbi:MAG: hypothetical protein ACPGR4_00765, partial [Paracoccaceae bacterium]